MVQRQDYVALDWVKSEIDETLLQARGVLEAFVENTEDVAQLRFCLMHIHQVSGTLQMVQFFGAALLGEEMEHFCNAIVDHSIPPNEDNLSLLMQGILQLPTYLERVKVAKKDLPTVLLPLINQFRKERGVADLSEVVFFRPDFRSLFADLRDVDYRRFDDPRFIELVRKLRQMYQFSLIGLLRGEDLEKNWTYTLKVIDKLAEVTRGTPAGQLWFLCAGLVEGLSSGSIAFNIHAKKLLKSLEKALRQLCEGKSAKLHDRPDYELLRHSLFLVSESQGNTPRIQKVREAMGLAAPDSEPGAAGIGAPDKETMASVIEALLEELVQVKDSLDIMVRGKVYEIQSLASLVPSIKYIADTMAVVGLKVPQRMLLEQMEVINTVIATDEAPDDATLMNVAGAILYVEASLASSLTRKGIYGLDDSASPRLEGAFEAVIHEARNGLEQSKDAITEFISGQFDQKFLSGVPATLTTISGGLHIIQLEKASQILLASVQYVNDKLISQQHKPDWEELDVLADALMGVEYYLERITQDGEHTNEKWLQQAESSIEKLGYRLADNWDKRQAAGASKSAKADLDPTETRDVADTDAEIASPENDAVQATEAESVATVTEGATLEIESAEAESFEAVETEAEVEQNDFVELVEAESEVGPIDLDNQTDALGNTGDEQEQIADPVTDVETVFATASQDEEVEAAAVDILAFEDNDSLDVEQQVPEADHQTSADVAAESLPAQDNSDLIDDEIIEIFLEEAAEVLETIHEYMPKFVRDESDQESLTEFRRAFHTLKGSGRMVGAAVIGELAWSVENMLNRLLDGSIKRNHDLISLLDQVVALLPDLIEDFRTSQTPDRPEVAQLSHMADSIGKGTWTGAPAEVESLVVPTVDTRDTDDAADQEVEIQDEALPILEDSLSTDEVVGFDDSLPEDSVPVLDDYDPDTVAVDQDDEALIGFDLTGEAKDSIETVSDETDAIEVEDETLIAYDVASDIEDAAALEDSDAINLTEDGSETDVSENWDEALTRRLLGDDSDESAEDDGSDDEFVALIDNTDDDIEELVDDAVSENPESDDSIDIETLEASLVSDADDDISSSANESEPLPVASVEEDDSDDGIDDLDASLIAIFKGELEIHLRQVESLIDDDFDANPDIKVRSTLQRTLNTIQGSAQAASFAEIAQVSLAAELLVKDCIARGVVMDEAIAGSLRNMVSYIRSALDEPSNEQLSRECQNCLAGLYIVHQLKLSEFETIDTSNDNDVMSLFMSANMDVILDAEHMVSQWQANGHSSEDIAVLTRGLHELAVSADRIRLRPISQLSDGLIEYYHNLGASAPPADNSFYAVALEAQEQLINMIDRLAAGQSLKFATAVESDLAEKQAWLINQEAQEAARRDSEQQAKAAIESLSADADAQHADWVEIDTDPDLLEIFLDEAQDILEVILMDYQQWKADPSSHKIIGGLQRSLHTMKGGARMANIAPIGDLAHELETLYEGLYEGRFKANSEMFAMVEKCHDTLGDMIDDTLHEGRCRPAARQVSMITTYVHRLLDTEHSDLEPVDGLDDLERILASDDIEPDLGHGIDEAAIQAVVSGENEESAPIDPTPVATEDSPADDTSEPVVDADVDLEADPEVSPEAEAPKVDLAVDASTDIDPDILEIFLDEANELLHDLDSLIHAWQGAPINDEVGDNLKRVLHTLKGGARLAKLTSLGDKSHEFETYVIHFLRDNPKPNDAFFKEIIRLNDDLVMGLEQLEKGLAEKALNENATANEADTLEPPGEETPAVASPDTNVAVMDSSAQAQEVNRAAANKTARQAKQRARGNQPQETVKVSANLLENLVNLAGETSITRSRLEQEVSDFGYTLVDMEATIDRLRDQVRRLDIETEEQMTFRQERAEESNYVDFDPLEMDRYSSMQQLSRSLMEAASDLYDFKGSLADKARDAETILLQQARINTQLHEGLMQTRMVPFNRLVPRLRRIVRQISDETHKNVDLVIHHADGELDRTVLEHMVSPLEHILRNAVDHGIEMPSDRTANGKNAKGRIDLTLSREAGEAVITIADDGAGINIDKVRKKAIERGLITQNQSISDQEVLQFILSSGFTTAERVTQISGRGVGMDVVHSEVRALGGTISIDTESGSGTNFVIRLPVNVSVSRALMVNLGDDLYAIPLDSIEGIVRVQSQDAAVYLGEDGPVFNYAGTDYRVQYLGELLGADRSAGFQANGQAVPLILAKQSRGKESIAFYVDHLLGSKEIVVKPLGPQFSGVRSLSGATILGDGSVVVILDLISMLRLDMTIGQKSAADLKAIAKPGKRLSKVMIIDDSVTVRKVTTRLLERHGMEAKTAKDGADAILILQEYTPDLILLDIEMPRMDGFEVASRVRHDPNLKDIPIIMITSRTGDKHRERAFSIGVNAYMGKPFQEGPLLAKIKELIEQEKAE